VREQAILAGTLVGGLLTVKLLLLLTGMTAAGNWRWLSADAGAAQN
jgi:hypothetical protein